MHRFMTMIAALMALAAMPSAWAAEPGHDGQKPGAAQSATTPMTAGVVRKVDKAAGKITIRHDEIENLGMPPMTMVFRVKEAAWLDSLQPGDKIHFLADKVNGVFTVLGYELAN